MAPSLRDLIDFLLAEIALCGDQGASPADILTFIDTFYAKAAQDAAGRAHTVDRRFQEKVWSWLMKNPEVSVGKDREGNYLSLRDAERGQTSAETDQAANGASDSARVFVSKERTWLAVAGHGPDETKVFPTEFALLSIIASRKHNGIAQTELVRVSGQDKRSVPKRTDVLQQKGYIEKRAIQVKSTRTSLCTLRKFLTPEHAPVDRETGQDADATKQENMIDFKEFLDQLFQILQEYQIISRNDLKQKLGFQDHWRWRILSRALRKFERIGVLKRVRALSQYADTLKKFHPCVMLIREPTERDFELFNEFSRGILSNLEQEDNLDIEDDMEQDGTSQSPLQPNSNGTVGLVKREAVEEAGRILPSWSPDRSIHNQIFEIVDRTGTDGITNQGILRACFGGYFRRPLENAVSRLVECWQLSQPLHLRHLAIVRDTALQRTITHYVHYTAMNFKQLVDSGEALWEAVEFSPKKAKSISAHIHPVDAAPQLDAHGLTLAVPKKELCKDGNVTLLECISVVKPANYVFSGSDAVAARREDGTYTIHQRIRGSGDSTAQPYATPVRVKIEGQEGSDTEMADVPSVKPIKSRPRKSQLDPEVFRGMSEKEKLETLGLDETWTEYSILLIERTGPGVYVTTRGRRRPAGKRQGRPKISRIAVFKTPKLATLPWFQKDTAEPDDDSVIVSRKTRLQASGRTQSSPVVDDGVPPQSTSPALSVRGSKRLRQDGSDTEYGLEGENAPKHRRVEEVNGDSQNGSPTAEPLEREPEATQTSPLRRTKRKRAASPMLTEEGPSQADDGSVLDNVSTRKFPRSSGRPATRNGNIETFFKRARSGQALRDRKGTTTESTAETGEGNDAVEDEPEASAAERPSERGTVTNESSEIATTNDMTQQSLAEPAAPKATEQKKSAPEAPEPSGRKRRIFAEKGGSVAVLRRSIVMDILEQAGGAYPMGTEIWYPFMTAWQKKRHKEIPDLRTIRSVVKTMVDAGKVRQLTFSGRDRKGVMVTKKIIYKADMKPDDPLILDMQKEMLATDRYYFPPNVEIDPEISKNGNRGTPRRDEKLLSQLPVERGITVQLHQKPAMVRAVEKRRRHMLRSELLQHLSMGEEYETADGAEIVRLMTLSRRGDQDDPRALTSISRSGRAGDGPRRGQRQQVEAGLASLRKMRRLWSTIAPHAMLMNTKPTFHATTGTFGTEAGIPAIQAARDRAKAAGRKKTPDLPHSLDDLFSQTRRRVMDDTGDADPRSRQFFRDNNTILKWELSHEDLLRRKSADLFYINQTVQNMETPGIEGDIRFDVDEQTGNAATEVTPMITRHKARLERQTSQSRRRRSETATEPGHRRLTKLNESIATDGNKPATAQPVSRQPLRRSRLVSQMPRTLVQQFIAAIVAVRSLAGGSDARLVDWSLLCCCFPDLDPAFVIHRARGILGKYRLQIAKLQGDFQERFIEAYANNEVPPIDYDNLEGYDWKGVIEWANTKLDAPKSEKLPDLPATREQFDSVFELREEALVPIDELYQTNQSITVGRKRALIAGVPFAAPLPEKSNRPQPRRAELSRLEVVKTWVRANVVTPEEKYRPAEARQALEMFGEHVVQQALQSLVTERALSMGNRGRITPGRNYDVTEYFLLALGRRRVIESTELRRAQRFKTEILDPTLRKQGYMDIDYNAEDGDMLVVINLFATGRVVLHPRDVPREKYGLTDGGYLTRQIDKDKLRFSMEVRPAKSYVYGNPIQETMRSLVAPRPQGVDAATQLPAKIPLWYDIHGSFVRVLWDMALAAVVGCVATRPGINASVIAGMLKPTMGEWEVQLLLDWLEGVGVATQESGWVVREWWWMVLGDI
ncbi:putative TFIIIC transcription initiation factor complex subunits Tfc3 [Aspergillus tubingensis]|uniref:putative TFIIIC transcription initiation factor complex subunits Tfc3 n=1 Tax=Aspergillus tubingensis TaxID=5068 RepID=UPI00157925E8|nr:TFIIIC transcription initiation factor complex subunits Tfc3 [Aspergillus tubingensis]GFN12655.1 TFIIIC transcription initiation factor complex subunits Tfc3 [Aspergillus tubingensis]